MSNIVILAGNLGADPDLRYSGGGKPILNLRVATTERWEQGGEQRERTDWHTVVMFGGKAEDLGRSLTKGSRVYVEGSLQTRSWEKDGQKKYSTEVVAKIVIGAGMPTSERAEPRQQAPAARQGGGYNRSASADPGAYRPAAQQAPAYGGPMTQGPQTTDDDIPF